MFAQAQHEQWPYFRHGWVLCKVGQMTKFGLFQQRVVKIDIPMEGGI